MAQEEILFGTGELFVVPDSLDLEVATETEINDALVKVGESNGEAQLSVSYDFVDVRGGVGNQILKSFKTSETITFNAGFVTYDLNVISEFLAGNYGEDATEGLRTFELGGEYSVPVKRLRFVHTKPDGYRIIMDMHKAQNRSGLDWTFNSEQNSVFEFEFTLMKDTNKNNIVKITEEIEPTVAG